MLDINILERCGSHLGFLDGYVTSETTFSSTLRRAVGLRRHTLCDLLSFLKPGISFFDGRGRLLHHFGDSRRQTSRPPEIFHPSCRHRRRPLDPSMHSPYDIV